MAEVEEKQEKPSVSEHNEPNSNNLLYSKTTLFVRRIPYDASNDEFETFFSEIGPLRSCFLVKDKEPNVPLADNSINHDDSIVSPINDNKEMVSTQEIQKNDKNKGFGFVQFVLTQDAEKALKELKKVKFRGKSTLKMEYAIKRHDEHSQQTIKRKFLLEENNSKKKLVKKETKGFVEKVDNNVKTIVLKGLPKDLTRKKIYKKVRKFGDIQDMKFPNGEDSTDIVHVIFKTTKDANDALSHLDGHVFHGSMMSAKLWNTSSNDKKGRLIVRNIPWQYREQELLKIFSKYGEIIEAINGLNETKHQGRTIAVDWALPKDKYLEAIESQKIHDKVQDNSDVSESENDDSVINGNHILNDDEDEEDEVEAEDENMESASESESDDIEIHDETPKNLYPPSEGTVLFIRNLSFDATEEELSEIFKPFGPLRYCVITMDHQTGRSRGTGFVCFKQREHAEIKFTLRGRVLSIVKAVDRNEAHNLMEMNQQKRRKEDKRNIYLLQEGVIFPDSLPAKLLTTSEVNKRVTSYSFRKNLLAKNPNLYISKTRLSVRNLPLSVDESTLKKLGKESVKKFKEEVENEERKDLTKSEKMEGWNKKVDVKQAKVIRAKDRIDKTTQKPRSKGYGFLEFTQHAHALAALRHLNNNPELFGEKKRLIVEFAVENSIIVKKRAGRSNNKHIKNKSVEDNVSVDKRKKVGVQIYLVYLSLNIVYYN
ncbi:778_t:CDS:2 [Funneliformis geosporum]|uniref:15765_t:CDS:1 n=1 Tax=Funneliformis geosporum TaxID=1117311 RepID=A0A9W4WQY0_9GLOM|nr:778_t:CDS:2 [Funneliformis geosporum]CAI2165445.1 15765_t:CDS:2 [Funneliformis geosporum]